MLFILSQKIQLTDSKAYFDSSKLQEFCGEDDLSIMVKIDSDDIVLEIDETNNEQNTSISLVGCHGL